MKQGDIPQSMYDHKLFRAQKESSLPSQTHSASEKTSMRHIQLPPPKSTPKSHFNILNVA